MLSPPPNRLKTLAVPSPLVQPLSMKSPQRMQTRVLPVTPKILPRQDTRVVPITPNTPPIGKSSFSPSHFLSLSESDFSRSLLSCLLRVTAHAVVHSLSLVRVARTRALSFVYTCTLLSSTHVLSLCLSHTSPLSLSPSLFLSLCLLFNLALSLCLSLSLSLPIFSLSFFCSSPAPSFFLAQTNTQMCTFYHRYFRHTSTRLHPGVERGAHKIHALIRTCSCMYTYIHTHVHTNIQTYMQI